MRSNNRNFFLNHAFLLINRFFQDILVEAKPLVPNTEGGNKPTATKDEGSRHFHGNLSLSS